MLINFFWVFRRPFIFGKLAIEMAVRTFLCEADLTPINVGSADLAVVSFWNADIRSDPQQTESLNADTTEKELAYDGGWPDYFCS